MKTVIIAGLIPFTILVLAMAVTMTVIFFRIVRRNETHRYRIINLHYKKISSRTVKKQAPIMLLAIIVSSCSPCRNLTTDSNYMVWIQEGVKKNYDCVENGKEADGYIYKVSGLQLVTDSLIGKRKPYLYLDNGDYEVYVERESSWKKRRK